MNNAPKPHSEPTAAVNGCDEPGGGTSFPSGSDGGQQASPPDRPQQGDDPHRFNSGHAETLESAIENAHGLLFAENPLAMWVFDAESLQILDVNSTMVEEFGMSREALLAMTMEDLISPVSFDQPPRSRSASCALDRTERQSSSK